MRSRSSRVAASSRRRFLAAAGVSSVAAGLSPALLRAAEPSPGSTAETIAQALHATLSPTTDKVVHTFLLVYN